MDSQPSYETPIIQTGSPDQNTPVYPSPSKLKQNFLRISIIVCICLVLLGFGYYVLFVQQPSKPRKGISPSIVPLVADWKGYRNKDNGFSFRYPPTWTLDQTKGLITIKKTGTDANSISIQKIDNAIDLTPKEVIINTAYKGETLNPGVQMRISNVRIERISMGSKKPYLISNITTVDGSRGPYVWIPSEGLLIETLHPFSDKDKMFRLLLSTFVFKKPQKPFVSTNTEK